MTHDEKVKRAYARGRAEGFDESLQHLEAGALADLRFRVMFPDAPKWQLLSCKYGELALTGVATGIRSLSQKSRRKNLESFRQREEMSKKLFDKELRRQKRHKRSDP